ncbi:malignant fibrous histiocytoma-amplified sequence 1 homolog isoform X2 [Esox lucius]|uniref:malignant fibrous histiocytoma-amplified sequence 1 homolog isoform X2 n=1 Tax=Esox lucius TaxID=8010 RepID=UPI00097320B7|nr:malignant fibrous histiocytoma-amplified sequence 1 homolog isoform X2 [Esox lucius]
MGPEQSKKDWDLSGRKLKSLPPNFTEKAVEARRLDLQKNKLRKLSEISSMVHLRELNLSRNELVDFPLEIKSLRQLERLYLNQNNIKVIPEDVFCQLGNLQFLKLSTNRLAKLPADLSQCHNLSYVNLSNNCLQDLQALVGLPKLKELLVERNGLTELPAQLFQKGNSVLTLFKATGNPLRTPPEEVCDGGVRDIQSYFAMMEEESSDMHSTASTVKTMFLGSSMAGKSTLCRSLQHGRPVRVDKDERTEGIEISEIDMAGVRLLFWDFAGQEEYYLTHHVFITPRALVILAVDLASYKMEDPQSYKEKVCFWINNIQLRVPASVVLLVGTHCDQCRDQEEVRDKKKHIEEKVRVMLEERKMVLQLQKNNLKDKTDQSLFSKQMSELDRLMEYNLQVLDLIAIDCTRDEEIVKLKEHIVNQVLTKDTFPCAERTLPKSYKEVEVAIQHLLKHNQIPQHGIVSFHYLLNDLIPYLELGEENVQSILRYLHRIGIIVWYEEIPALKDKVFVQPSFLISIFKTIVRPDLVKQLEAFHRDDLRQEGCLVVHRGTWVEDFREKGTLHNVATRILARKELRRLGLDDEDLVNEVVGSKNEEGTLLLLLQHFEVCLPAKLGSSLNPEAPEFKPCEQWKTPSPASTDPDGACLFPSYLLDNKMVVKMWGEDRMDDINVHVYFLPEIPHGFFHRLIIKTCSLYPTHWIGKDHCLLSSGEKLLLMREISECNDEDQYIQIRCRRPENSEYRRSWDFVMSVMSKLAELSRQWPGLSQHVHTPCKEKSCTAYFAWRDWQDLTNTDIYDLVQEEKQLCRNGHTRRTELLFPKDPVVSRSKGN